MTELKPILSVDTSKGVDSIRALKDEINSLKQSLEQLEIGSKEYNATQDKLIKEQSRLNDVMAGTKGRSSEAEGSYYALNKQLVELRQSYRRLSEEQRNGIVGAKTLDEIRTLDAQLKALDADMGQHFRNVGNYSNSIVDAFSKMGISFGAAGNNVVNAATNITNSFMNMGKGAEQSGSAVAGLWKTLTTNPIGIVIAALGGLTAAFMAVRKAVDDNEESQNRLHIAMSAFQPMKDQMTRLLDSMGVAFTVMAADIGEAVRQTREMIAAWKDWMGITSGEAERVRQENENYKKLAEAEVGLQKLRRRNRVENAKDNATIHRLRQEASETKNAAEQAAKLNEAMDLQRKINERNLKEAQANLAIKKANDALTPNSIKANDELAEAEAKVYDVTTQNADALRTLDRALNKAENSTEKLTQAEKDQLAAFKIASDEAVKLAMEEIDRELTLNKKREDTADALLYELEKKRRSRREQEWYDYSLQKEQLQLANKDTELLEQEHQKRLAEIEYAETSERIERREELRQKEKSNTVEPSIWDTDARNALYDADLEAYTKYIEDKMALNAQLMQHYTEDSEEFKKLDKENADLRMKYQDAVAENGRKKAEDYKKLEKAKAAATKQFVGQASGLLKDLSAVMGENTRMGKGFAIAAATIDTIASAVAGFRAGYNQWKDTGYMAFMAPIQAAINATAALVAGYAQVQKIQSVDTSGNASAGGGVATALAVPNIEGLSSPVDYTRQVTTETEQEELNRNNRVYILESDIQESGNRVRVRENETTF